MTAVDNIQQTLLLVDDEENVLNSLVRLLRPLNCSVETALSGEEALEKMALFTPDMIISDVKMPGMDGVQLLSTVALDYPDTERVLLTGYSDIESAIEAINVGGVSHYVQKPWDGPSLIKLVEKTLSFVSLRRANERLQATIKNQNNQLKQFNHGLEKKVLERTKDLDKANEELEKTNQSLKNSYHNFVELFMRLLSCRLGSAYQNDHLASRLAVDIGRTLGMSDGELISLHFATKLRHVGLLELSDDILNAPISAMDTKQLQKFKSYPQLSYALLSSQPALFPAAEIILAHREQLDGKGFPDQLTDDQLSLPAKILAVVNMFEALTKGQQMDEILTVQYALSYLSDRIGSHYSNDAVSALIYLIESNTNYEKEQRLSVRDLVETMVLSRDLNNKAGSLLLARGTLLDTSVISKLNDLDSRLNEPLALYVYT